MYFSQNTAIKRHIYGYPSLYWGATTIQIHQGEGMSTFEMTPNSSIFQELHLEYNLTAAEIIVGWLTSKA